MLHKLCHITSMRRARRRVAMSIGNSGRIVIEIDPEFKQDLYAALEKEGMNLKQWFIKNAKDYLKGHLQLSLELGSPKESNQRGVSNDVVQ